MSEKLDIDPAFAVKLFEEGAVFLFLDVPVGTEFGIDLKSWNTAENFRGIKMIPPGLHFVHYSPVDSCGESGPRSGFFHYFKQREFVVKKWDKVTEGIKRDDCVSEEQVKRLKDNIYNLDKYLGPYPYPELGKWSALTNQINEALVEKLSPTCGIISSALDLMPCGDSDRPRGHSNEASTSRTPRQLFKQLTSSERDAGVPDLRLPELKPVEGTAVRFTPVPKQHYPTGATPEEITKHSMDHSYLLQLILNNYASPLDFLGEMQFAFVSFVVGHSFEAFEQWQELLCLVCSCDDAITKYRALYDNLIDVLEIQIAEIHTDFLADIVTNTNFVYIKLKNLFRSVQESSVDGRLKSKVTRFKDALAEKFNWDFSLIDEDSDDDLPVVVDIGIECN